MPWLSKLPFPIWFDLLCPHYLQSHRLLIRIGDNTLCPMDRSAVTEEKRLPFFSSNSSEKHTALINFDDIGSEEFISVPGVEGKLKAQVFSEGPTKVLKVFPAGSTQEDKELNYAIGFINAQIAVLEELIGKVNSVFLNGSNQDQVIIRDLMNNAQEDIVKKQLHLLEVQDQWDSGSGTSLTLRLTHKTSYSIDKDNVIR